MIRLVAMADADDPSYTASRRVRDSCMRGGGVLVTTDYVIDETLTLIRRRVGLRAVTRWWTHVSAGSRVRWEWIDPIRAEKARRWFFKWNDKDFSFTDCTSFVVMKELRIHRALTTDRHFSQAGFESLPA